MGGRTRGHDRHDGKHDGHGGHGRGDWHGHHGPGRGHGDGDHGGHGGGHDGGDDGSDDGGPGDGGGFEGLYVVSVTGTVTRGSVLGEDVAGEDFTLSYAINFNDPVVETDGETFTTYIDQEPRGNSVIISARVGDLKQEDVVENTVGPQETDRTRLTLSDERPDLDPPNSDALAASIRGESGVYSYFHDSFILFGNPSGTFTDSVSLEQAVTYDLQAGDTASVAYSLFDNITFETTHSFTGSGTSISLNGLDPEDLFEPENLALLGFPVEEGCASAYW